MQWERLARASIRQCLPGRASRLNEAMDPVQDQVDVGGRPEADMRDRRSRRDLRVLDALRMLGTPAGSLASGAIVVPPRKIEVPTKVFDFDPVASGVDCPQLLVAPNRSATASCGARWGSPRGAHCVANAPAPTQAPPPASGRVSRIGGRDESCWTSFRNQRSLLLATNCDEGSSVEAALLILAQMPRAWSTLRAV